MGDEIRIVDEAFVRGRQYQTLSDGTQQTRKVDIRTNLPRGDWTQVETFAEPEPEPAQLHLVVESRAEGEPNHWSLFAYQFDNEGVAYGQVWQVMGDTEHMRHAHESNVAHFRSLSFIWQQNLNANLSNDEFVRVDEVARSEPPPRARNRTSIRENCQDWVIRVLLKLSEDGIVDYEDVVDLQRYMDPINLSYVVHHSLSS